MATVPRSIVSGVPDVALPKPLVLLEEIVFLGVKQDFREGERRRTLVGLIHEIPQRIGDDEVGPEAGVRLATRWAL